MSVRDPIVTVTGLSKSYGRLAALCDVSFSIRDGEILGLIGPNGAGKTTLFECVAGVQPADGGRVTCGGRGAPARPCDILFYLPDAIAPWADERLDWVLRFVLHFFGGSANRLPEVVERIGIASLMGARIGTMSKGQRKRALLAIGLLTPQPVLFIDEPFEGLDLRQGREVAGALKWHASSGRTLFVSIHQILEAGRFCDRLVLLSNGRVCAEGTALELTTMAAGRIGDTPADFEEVFLALA
jgi:ABC-2 type transport system ATP-binding protein